MNNPARHHFPILCTLLVLCSLGVPAFGQSEQAETATRVDAVAEVGTEPQTEGDWIRPEEIVDRADSLGSRLNSVSRIDEARELIERVTNGIDTLDPSLDATLASARDSKAASSTLVSIQDARRALRADLKRIEDWKAEISDALKNSGENFAILDSTQKRWAATLQRPETLAAGEAAVRRVEKSIALLAEFSEQANELRAKLLSLSDRLLDRSAAVNSAMDKLQAVTRSEGANILRSDKKPLWNRDLLPLFATEVKMVFKVSADFRQSTFEYIALDGRQFLLQGLLALVLMALFRSVSVGWNKRTDPESFPEAERPLRRPYSMGLLFALMTSSVFHAAAPQRVMQVVALLMVLPVTRILRVVDEHTSLRHFIGLVTLLLLDRTIAAATDLPTLALVAFLLQQALGLLLAYSIRSDLRRRDANRWLPGLMTAAMYLLTTAILAEIGGWSTLASLIGRGVMVSVVSAVYVSTTTISLEALLSHLLASPTLRSSRFIDHNQALLQPWASKLIRAAGVLFWLDVSLSSLGLRVVAVDALNQILGSSMTVGALTLSLGGILAFVVTLLIVVVVNRLIQEILEDEIFPRAKLPRGIPHALLTITRYSVYSLGFLFALASAGVQVSQLAILMGGLGVGIGLGLQDVVKNFAAGLTLLLERRFQVGDTVEITSKGIFGRIQTIGMRASVVRNWDGAEVVMPNDDLVAGAITNWTLTDRMHRIEVKVGVAYGTDPDQVLKLLIEAGSNCEHVLKSPAPTSFFRGFGDSSLDFMLRAWTDDGYESTAAVVSALGMSVHRSLHAAGITIPFPQRDVHFYAATDSPAPLPPAPAPAAEMEPAK